MSPSSLVRGLQERAARALPAAHVEQVDGWWRRAAPGCAWWVGTVLPHGDGSPDQTARRVAGAEEFYGRRCATARFQIAPGACPDGLDALLAARGYGLTSPMWVLTATAPAVGAAAAPAGEWTVRLDERPTPAWFDAWHGVHGEDRDPRSEWDLLGRVDRPSAYAGVTAGDQVLAVGRAVADTRWTGVYGMATRPAARRSGAARAVLAALAGWAAAQRAPRLHLQVERDNDPAVQLYRRMGFTEAFAYHYRTAG